MTTPEQRDRYIAQANNSARTSPMPPAKIYSYDVAIVAELAREVNELREAVTRAHVRAQAAYRVFGSDDEALDEDLQATLELLAPFINKPEEKS